MLVAGCVRQRVVPSNPPCPHQQQQWHLACAGSLRMCCASAVSVAQPLLAPSLSLPAPLPPSLLTAPLPGPPCPPPHPPLPPTDHHRVPAPGMHRRDAAQHWRQRAQLGHGPQGKEGVAAPHAGWQVCTQPQLHAGGVCVGVVGQIRQLSGHGAECMGLARMYVYMGVYASPPAHRPNDPTTLFSSSCSPPPPRLTRTHLR